MARVEISIDGDSGLQIRCVSSGVAETEDQLNQLLFTVYHDALDELGVVGLE